MGTLTNNFDFPKFQQCFSPKICYKIHEIILKFLTLIVPLLLIVATLTLLERKIWLQSN